MKEGLHLVLAARRSLGVWYVNSGVVVVGMGVLARPLPSPCIVGISWGMKLGRPLSLPDRGASLSDHGPKLPSTRKVKVQV